MWLSDHDMVAGFERAVTAPDSLRFARVNLVSDNAGMAWDLQEARDLLGYAPASESIPDAPADPIRAGRNPAGDIPRGESSTE
jgi:hypothetical protein